MGEISQQLKQESSGWGAAIGGAAIGGAIAMLIGGPLTWLIGGGVLIGTWLFGNKEKSEEKKRQEAMTRPLNYEERAKVCDSLQQKWEDICSNVETSIRASLEENETVKNSINKITRELLQAYKDGLRNSRILID